MRHIFQTLLAAQIFAVITLISYAQSNEQNVSVTIRPSQTVEERVADSIQEKELREAAEEKLAAEKSERLAANSPRAILGRAQTVFISSGTSFFEPVQLQNALRKRAEFDEWGMAIIDGWDKHNVADIAIEINRPLFTYTFTYKITARATSVLLTAGKVTAFDSNAAAPLLAKRIVEDMKKARGEARAK